MRTGTAYLNVIASAVDSISNTCFRLKSAFNQGADVLFPKRKNIPHRRRRRKSDLCDSPAQAGKSSSLIIMLETPADGKNNTDDKQGKKEGKTFYFSFSFFVVL